MRYFTRCVGWRVAMLLVAAVTISSCSDEASPVPGSTSQRNGDVAPDETIDYRSTTVLATASDEYPEANEFSELVQRGKARGHDVTYRITRPFRTILDGRVQTVSETDEQRLSSPPGSDSILAPFSIAWNPALRTAMIDHGVTRTERPIADHEAKCFTVIDDDFPPPQRLEVCLSQDGLVLYVERGSGNEPEKYEALRVN
jgi:hypothetical protein